MHQLISQYALYSHSSYDREYGLTVLAHKGWSRLIVIVDNELKIDFILWFVFHIMKMKGWRIIAFTGSVLSILK